MTTSQKLTSLLAGAVLTIALAGGCISTRGPVTGAPVEAVLTEQGQLARAAAMAARETNRKEPSEATRATIDAELGIAEALLPTPTGSQIGAASTRASRSIDATVEQRAALYTAASNRAAELERALVAARITEAKRAEAESGRRDALMMQTRITTYAAIGFMGLGVIFGFASNVRLGLVTIFLGGLLLAASRIIATVPDWAYTTLFITAGVIALLTPAVMWWAYRVGIWTKPKTCGEYAVNS